MFLVSRTLLIGFEKIPFACSYLPGKGNLHFVFWACALFLLPLINAAAQFEMQILFKDVPDVRIDVLKRTISDKDYVAIQLGAA